jgi:endoglucanase
MLSKIKNISLVIVIFSLFLLPLSSLYAVPSWLHVNGNQIEDTNGNAIVLRGISLPDLGYLDSSYDDMNALELIDKITDTDSTEGASPGWYPKIVRIPIYPPQTTPAQAPYYWDPANPDDFYNNYIRPVVDYCGEKNLYVIIDWHQTDNTYDEVADTNTFWTYMAPKFAGDSHVLFELFNEPNNNIGDDTENWDSVRSDMQTWVDIIRTYAPDNIILVGTPNECTMLGPVIANPIVDNNVIYVAHIFPSQWQGGTEEIDLDSIVQCAEIYPVFVSEWGYMATADIDLQRYNGTKAGYGLPLKAFLEEYGISNTACVAAYNWYPPMFRTQWTHRNSATEMGCFAKDWLYEKSGIFNTPETTTLKCKIKAGKTQFAQQGPDANDINKMKDTFQFSGTYATKPLLLTSITEMDINIVSLDDNEIIYSESIDFNSLDVVNDKFKYSYKIPKGHAGAITSLKMNFAYKTFSIKAKKTDLTGLGAPLRLTFGLGNNILSSEVDETIINKSRIIPTRLMRLYDDKLVVTRARVSSSIYPLSDSLSVKGDIAVENMDLDANEPNLVNVDVNFIWGDQTLTVPKHNFLASKKGHYYRCSKVPMDVNDCNAGLVTAKINLDKCTFKVSVKKADDLDIGLDDGFVRFGINFGDDDFNQPADVNVVTGRSY